jgi:hypothetical protein
MELAYSTGQNKGYIQVYNRSAAPGVNPWGNLYLGDGNVGIGNGYPNAKLEVLTSAANSTGLYSRATSTGSATNYGGHFEAAGEDSYAVYGLASEASNFGQNFGGFFKAQGRAGIGVRGETTGNNGYGVLGVAAGTYGTGVSGTHSSGNTARLGTASYAGDFQGNVNISGNIFRSISGGSYGTLPVAFGGIDGWGDVFSSDMTGNYSVYRNCDQRRYEVSIEGENYDDRYYVTLITLTGADYSPVRIAQTRSEENKLLIYLKDIWGSNQLVCDQNDLHSFHFIVYKQ